MNDYYADLGVARDADPEEIKRAYRRAARRLHPDVNAGPEAEEKFKKVSQAYDVLSDPEKKQAYDMGSDPYAAGAAGFGQGFSFSDIMDAFFGGQTASAGARPAIAHHPRPGRSGPPGHRPRGCRLRGSEGPHDRHRRHVQHVPRERHAAGHLDPHV